MSILGNGLGNKMGKWIELDGSMFEAFRSRSERQPLPREQWPSSFRTEPKFTRAWLTPVLDSPATSISSLSTGSLYPFLETERTHPKGAPRRHDYYYLAGTIDDRLFLWSVPDKNVKDGHHRFGLCRSTST